MINFLSGAGKKMPVRGHVCNIYIYIYIYETKNIKRKTNFILLIVEFNNF